MVVSYHESHPGSPGYGWDAESLGELARYLDNDRDELYQRVRSHLNKLGKGGTQTISYVVTINISK